MNVTIISVGKKHDALYTHAIHHYQNRLEHDCTINWQFIPPSTQNGLTARTIESKALLHAIKPTDMVWLLDERGENVSSPALSAKIHVLKTHAIKHLVLVIGGAYGVDDSVHQRAQWVWSLSRLVFPHQVVRLLVVEQLYRALQIERGTGYHHA